MANEEELVYDPYACSKCGENQDRTELVTKRASFYRFGRSGRMIRSRTVAWLCPECLIDDPDWNRGTNRGGVLAPPKRGLP